jgi:putative two-component system response regulator
MYGLTDRITRTDTAASTPGSGLAPVITLSPRASVLVVDHDPSTLQLIRTCLDDSCHIAVARDGGEALEQVHSVRPAVVLLDTSIDEREIQLIAEGLADAGLEAIPLLMIDPTEPLNGEALRERVQAAVHVTRRVWFGGGLRSRMAA